MKKAIVMTVVIIMTLNQSVIAGTIEGTVRKESDNKPIIGLWVEATDYDTGQYRGGAMTHSGGYVISGLHYGNYRVMVSARNTDFVEEYYDNVYHEYLATPVYVPAFGVVQNINFSLKDGYKVSGKVTDKATGLALDNIRVTYWHGEYGVFAFTYTDIEGKYTLSRLLPGEVGIGADPESYYGMMGATLGLWEDINNLDFMLPVGASLSGKVINAETAQPLPKFEVTYWNDSHQVYQSDFSYGDGTFALLHLPPGVAEIKANPDIDTGYALWNLPLGCNLISLNEGEDKINQNITLYKGALVSGSITNPYGHPMSYFKYRYRGRLCQADSETDIDGRYEIRLPEGTYIITVDEDGYSAIPQIVTITDVNLPVVVPPIKAYSELTGGRISGSVNNPGGYTKNGDFIIAAFEAGTVIDPNTFIITEAISNTRLQQAGGFTIAGLPLGFNYDILLIVSNEETISETHFFTVRDSQSDVSVGQSDLILNYNSQGGTVSGKVLDINNQPVLGAIVLISDLATGRFAGWADADYNGNYIFYNVPARTYTVTAIHSKCPNKSATVQVNEDDLPNVIDIIMPCIGE